MPGPSLVMSNPRHMRRLRDVETRAYAYRWGLGPPREGGWAGMGSHRSHCSAVLTTVLTGRVDVVARLTATRGHPEGRVPF